MTKAELMNFADGTKTAAKIEAKAASDSTIKVITKSFLEKYERKSNEFKIVRLHFPSPKLSK